MDNNAKILGKPILHQTLPLTKTTADELPPPDTKRWVPRRKAVVVEAVLSGVITLEEVCRRYALSVDEFLSWRNAMEMHGVPGLRTTRRQIYRDPSHCSAGTALERLASVLNQKFLSTLGLDGDRAVTKPFDGGQDVVGGFGPAKGLGVGITGVDVGGDSGLQRGSRAVGAALDLLVGEQGEEALDLVDP